MNARTKLNASYLNGCLLFAALVGWLANSLWIFAITAILLVCGAVHASDIRLQSQGTPGDSTRPRR